MNLVTLEKISKQFSDRLLLDEVDLLINSGERIGLIGRNGSGKTTLLRIIAGLETADSGKRTVWGGVSLQYLSQDPRLDDNLTVLDTIFQSDAPQIQLLRQYESSSLALQARPRDAALQEHLLMLSTEMDRTGGWAAEAEAKTILTRLGIQQFGARVGTLSGGQRKRVALAQGLISPADLLILDEPTNHIDAETVAWLEEYLISQPQALLIVTHDRYLLDRVVNRIVALDRRKLHSYPGNYGRYLELNSARQEQLAKAEAKRQSLLRRELAWLRRSPMARGTKQKARIQRLQEMETLHYDAEDRTVAIALAGRRLGKRVLEAKGLTKSFGAQTLFTDLDLTLNPGDRIGVLGPNGAGKSSLLNILAGKWVPDSGTVAWGETVVLGYYDQESAELPAEQTLIAYINSIAPLIQTDAGERVDAAKMLEWFLFPGKEKYTQIGSLSGGERRRLYLLRTLIHRPNVLFLDEPTNDLDVETLTVLEQFLDSFQGCLVVVSHDRYFLDRNVDFLLSLEDGLLGTRYPTPYAAYLEARQVTTAVSTPSPKQKAAAKTAVPEKTKLTWKEQRELEALEQQMETLTAKIAELEAAVNSAGADYVRLEKLAAALATAKTELEAAEDRWLELETAVL